MSAADRALQALQHLAPEQRVAVAARRLRGGRGGPLARFTVGDERHPIAEHIDGSLLELVAARALDGAHGAVFTASAEARLLAALGLARVAARRGVDEAEALAALAGASPAPAALGLALAGVRVLDPCCGGGALLAAAVAAVRRCGAEPVLLGLDLSAVAAAAAAERLRLLGARADVAAGDALEAAWPAADLVLANPPFLRHEALPRSVKDRAAARSGLSRQADLSAHLTALALRHAPDVAVVWPRALDTARSAAPLVAEARARGGFAFQLRSRVAGSFAASVETALAVWSEGHVGRPACEAAVPLAALAPAEVASLARGSSGARLRRLAEGGPDARGAVRLDTLCEVRFGMKSGCNAFFHLRPEGGCHASALGGLVELDPGDAQPILRSLKEAVAPALARPTHHLFRPSAPGARALAYIARGEALGVARRPTCAGRPRWWLVGPGRRPAPVLYPAKIGARAFALLNAQGWWEDKKWHALFPRAGVDAPLLAAVLGATPVRLAVDAAARQLTGMQAIADVDCRVLAAAPVPSAAALAPVRRAVLACAAALADDPVTTDVAAMLARPAQEELDRAVGRALGLRQADVDAARRSMVDRVAARLTRAAQVRAAVVAREIAAPRREFPDAAAPPSGRAPRARGDGRSNSLR